MLILIMMRNALKMNCIQCWFKKREATVLLKREKFVVLRGKIKNAVNFI